MVDVSISRVSIMSLLVGMFFREAQLSTGTGFMVDSRIRPVLITTRHNVTGRHQDTDQPLSKHAGVPDRIDVWHNATKGLGSWVRSSYPIYDKDDQPLWREHPTLGALADIVAIPTALLEPATSYPYTLGKPTPSMFIGPADSVSVVGFPFGKTAGGLFPIWATGFIASEPNWDYEDKPIFLIDCRSRPGQSGSPVVAHRSPGVISLASGEVEMYPGAVTNLLGVYSGRINEQSDIGVVWKRSAIAELVDSLAPEA